MHGRTHGVSLERPDFVRSVERCWIDGDLVRLSSWPIGGIRPGGRAGPIPWLMDLSVLEEAMQEVYGHSFRLGDRAPLLQMTANALASGDRRRAADLANEVSFPPPEYASRLRDAGLRHLNWGPAHGRGNPPIDVDAWLERKAWERKFDPNQPRVPRGHPDGGQWTDGGAGGDESIAFDPDEPLDQEEWDGVEKLRGRIAETRGVVRRRERDLVGEIGGTAAVTRGERVRRHLQQRGAVTEPEVAAIDLLHRLFEGREIHQPGDGAGAAARADAADRPGGETDQVAIDPAALAAPDKVRAFARHPLGVHVHVDSMGGNEKDPPPLGAGPSSSPDPVKIADYCQLNLRRKLHEKKVSHAQEISPRQS